MTAPLAPAADAGCRALLDALGEPCFALDGGGVFRYGNPASAAFLGVPAAALAGRPLADAAPWFAASACRRACRRALETGTPQEAEDGRGDRHFRSRADPAADGVVVLARDVTEWHRAAEERRLAQELAHQAQKLDSLGLLAGGLAHEFNNLLVGMLTAADLLRRGLPEGGEPHALAELIKKAGERASNLTRQMLLYAGKGQPCRRPLDLNAAVAEALARLAGALPAKVAVQTCTAAELPAVEADPEQVRQVVVNLLLNAAEALGPDGGRVRVTTGVEDVAAAAGRAARSPLDPGPGRYAYVEVADDGCGLPPDAPARIFDPFFSTKSRGRGLGLSSVQGIVRAHGGAVRVAGVPGAGATFRVLLPVRTAGRPEPAPAAAGPAVSTPPAGVVLLIDDEPVVRGVVAPALRHLGLDVLSAGGGREGLEMFRANAGAVRLVLLDVGMPEQDGIQTLAALRAERPDVRVVLTSGAAPDDQLRHAALAPPAAFLPKPYTVHALLEVVGGALNGRPGG